MRLLKKYNEILLLAGFLIYRIALDISYVTFVHPLFKYVRFTLNFSLFKYILSMIVLVGLFLILPKDRQKPSSLVQQVHFILLFIPMLSLYPMMNLSTGFFLLVSGAFALECLLLRKLPLLKIVRLRQSGVILYGGLALVTVFVYVSMIRANGMPSLAALNLNAVYDIREKLSYPFLMGYLVPWQSKVINPFFIASAFKNKNLPMLGAAVALQLLLYLIIAEKAILFIPAVIVFVMWAVKRFNFLAIAGFLAPAGVIAISVFTDLTGKIEVASILIRRLLFLPAQLKFIWYDFFSENPLLYYSQGIIGKIFGIRNPYPLDAANMIGLTAFNAPDMHSNAGYVADAYGNGGAIGVIVIALIFVFVLLIVDSLSVALSPEFVIGLIIYHVISLNDGSLITAMISGGLLPLLLILWLYSAKPEAALEKSLAAGAPAVNRKGLPTATGTGFDN